MSIQKIDLLLKQLKEETAPNWHEAQNMVRALDVHSLRLADAVKNQDKETALGKGAMMLSAISSLLKALGQPDESATALDAFKAVQNLIKGDRS